MPRPNAILQSEYPYHVTARCLNKEWFKLPLQEVWEIMSRQLTYVSWVYKARIHAFVLMPNHFHLIVSTPQSNLDIIMRNFMKECSRFINEKTGRINSIYGSRHFRCVIQSDHYFNNAYKYVYKNPVQANLADKCENYPFSSLNFLLGGSKVLFPVVEDTLLFQDIESHLKWLNTHVTTENWATIHKAMHKPRFKIPKDRKYNKPHPLENDLM